MESVVTLRSFNRRSGGVWLGYGLYLQDVVEDRPRRPVSGAADLADDSGLVVIAQTEGGNCTQRGHTIQQQLDYYFEAVYTGNSPDVLDAEAEAELPDKFQIWNVE